MPHRGVDPSLLKAWITARSLARGLPMPVADHGGFRVDTNADGEVARWIFAQATPGLARLAQTIDREGYLLKLCGAAEELAALLPEGWTIHPPGYFMQVTVPAAAARLEDGYSFTLTRMGAVTHAQIFSHSGQLAAEGHAAETDEVFIYDRIATHPAHRRKGLARVLMAELGSCRQADGRPQVLVATEDGRALYSALGWETVSPYSTASFQPHTG